MKIIMNKQFLIPEIFNFNILTALKMYILYKIILFKNKNCSQPHENTYFNFNSYNF